MAVVCKAVFGFICLTLLLSYVSAAPPREYFGSHSEPSTSTQLTREEQDDDDEKNSIWDEDDDVFDLDGGSWLSQSPSGPLKTWPSLNQSPKPPDFDDPDEDNMIDDDEDESDDEEQESDENQSEFLLVPEADVSKRNLKVRHAGHNSDSDIDDSGLIERPDDILSDSDKEEEESYDLVSYPAADGDGSESNDIDDDDGDDDNDIFGEPDEEDSKKMFEDRVFLF